MPAPEYPDTVFGRTPRAYGTGRDGKAVRYTVIHYTAGSESRASAEAGNVYDSTRTDGTSCHVFHDPDSSVQEVLRKDRANSALHKGNRLGIHHELCGTAQTTAQWLDEASDAILWRAARAVAKDCVDYGLEPRRLSVGEVRAAWYSYPNGPRGICGHVDITRAYPEDGGDHTDPGTGFPWDIFIARVRQIMNGSPQGEDMTPEESILARGDAWRTDALFFDKDKVDDTASSRAAGVANNVNHAKAARVEMEQRLTAKLTAIEEKVDELADRPQVEPAPIDPATLKAALLDPEVVAVLVEAARQGANAAEDS